MPSRSNQADVEFISTFGKAVASMCLNINPLEDGTQRSLFKKKATEQKSQLKVFSNPDVVLILANMMHFNYPCGYST